MRAVITVIGKDNVGILHQVSGVCAKYQAADLIKLAVGYILIQNGVWISNIVED